MGLAGLVALALIVAPFPVDAALVAAPLGGILLLVHPALMPVFLIASVPAQDMLPIPEGIPLTMTRAAVLAAVGLSPLIVLARGRGFRLPAFLGFAAAFLVVIGLSTWKAQAPSLGYPLLYQWGVAILTFWAIALFVRTRRQALLIFALISVLAALQGLAGGLQALLGMGPESFELGMGISRAYGTFGMPNSYAAYLEATTLPLIPVLVWGIRHVTALWTSYRVQRLRGVIASTRLRREMIFSIGLTLVILAGTLAGLAGIVMSFSRGAWLGTAGAVAVVLLLLGRRVLITSAVGGIALLGVLLVAAPGPVVSVLDDRFTQLIEQAQIGDARGVTVTDDNFAAVERLAHWQTAIAMWDDHPWLGVGAGNFDSRFPEYAVHAEFTESQGHAHNYYLHLLAETGLAGLLVYAALLAAAFVVAWRAYRSPDLLARSIGVGSIGLTTALVIHNMVENLHVLNISIQIFAIWALAWIANSWWISGDDASRRNQAPRLLYDSAVPARRRPDPNLETGSREQH